MKLKPFFTYFGAKYRIGLRYPRPKHKTIIEPFAGAAGYSVRHHQHDVKLHDLNPKVVGTWDYLIRASPSEIRYLPLVFDDVRDLSVCQEAKWLIGWWLNKGHIQPCHIPGLWMRQKIRPHSFWGETIRDRLADQVKEIRHWKIIHGSYEDIPNEKATWFVDPPYQRSGRCYVFNEVDYPALARWTMERLGSVIACGQQGDDWLPFDDFIEAKGTEGKKMPGTTKEVIWLGGQAEQKKEIKPMNNGYTELHLKYRPKCLADVVGQDKAVASLTKMAKKGIPHSILFTGSQGVGKTTLARIMASMLECSEFDLHEINGADDRGIETARDLIQQARIGPMSGDVRCFIIDEIHQMSKKLNGDAQTTLLKIIEEPPKHTYFFAATTHPEELLPTLRSRFVEVKLSPIAETLLSDLVHDTALRESKPITDTVADAIARASEGSARVALKLLHQTIDLDEETALALCEQACGGDDRTVSELISAAVYQGGVKWPEIQAILSGLPKDTSWEGLRHAILTCADRLLKDPKSPSWKQGRAYQLIQAFRDSVIYIGSAGITAGFYEVFSRGK